jgi:hypothetical protein
MKTAEQMHIEVLQAQLGSLMTQFIDLRVAFLLYQQANPPSAGPIAPEFSEIR